MEQGEFAEAGKISHEGVRLAETLDHPPSWVLTSRAIGLLHLRRGEPQQAITALEHSLLLCRTVDLPLLFASAASLLGHAYALAGRVADALPLLEQAAEHGDGRRYMLEQSQRVTWLSEAYLRAGRMTDALRLAVRALDLARARKERGNEGWVLRLLGEVASSRDPRDAETAEGYYLQALALATKLEMRPLVAHCRAGLGRLYVQTGKRGQAHEHLTTAATMYREMGMTFWLEKVETVSASRES